MLERDIRKKSRDYATRRGWHARKWKSANARGVPDDLFFKAGRLLIVEFKATGKTPSPLQRREHGLLAQVGFTVHVIDNVTDFKTLIDKEETIIAEINYILS